MAEAATTGRAIGLLLYTGALLGVNFPLGKLAAGAGVPPLMWAMVVSAGAVGLMIPALVVQNRFVVPRGQMLRYTAVSGLVTFAAVNLLIPVLLPVDPTVGARFAAGVAVLAAVPLALQGDRASGKGKALLGGAVVIFLTVTLAFPQLVPPVPLRVQSATFASGIDRETLTLTGSLEDSAPSRALPEGLFVLFEVFAPTVVPTEVSLRWERDGVVLREGRRIEITAHEVGFRVWDAWRPQAEALAPGRYRVVMEPRARRVFGEATFVVQP